MTISSLHGAISARQTSYLRQIVRIASTKIRSLNPPPPRPPLSLPLLSRTRADLHTQWRSRFVLHRHSEVCEQSICIYISARRTVSLRLLSAPPRQFDRYTRNRPTPFLNPLPSLPPSPVSRWKL